MPERRLPRTRRRYPGSTSTGPSAGTRRRAPEVVRRARSRHDALPLDGLDALVERPRRVAGLVTPRAREEEKALGPKPFRGQARPEEPAVIAALAHEPREEGDEPAHDAVQDAGDRGVLVRGLPHAEERRGRGAQDDR